MKSRFFAKNLMAWYQKNKRGLPWRDTRNPYFIWLSEIILQQTRVQQGLPYYLKFTQAFPNIQSLAQASEHEIFSLWQGLGYYSRARNLHHTAKIIVQDHHSVFPSTYAELLQLKGIGPYTAAAIASFAFKEAVPVVDGNVYRVLSRFYGDETDISRPAARAHFMRLAQDLIPSDQPDEFNQAIMELGALVCTPKQALCSECPLSIACFAFKSDTVYLYPIKLKKTIKQDRFFNYIVFHTSKHIYLTERKEKDIWQNLWVFPAIESDKLLNETTFLNKWKHPLLPKLDTFSTGWKQTLSHRQVYGQFGLLKISEKDKIKIENAFPGKWFPKMGISSLPKPVLMNRFLKAVKF